MLAATIADIFYLIDTSREIIICSVPVKMIDCICSGSPWQGVSSWGGQQGQPLWVEARGCLVLDTASSLKIKQAYEGS